MYYDISNPNKRTLHSFDIQGMNTIYSTVKIKNEFKNPDGSLTNGGVINAEVNPGDYRDYDTDNLQNKEKSFSFNNGSQRRFEAKEQSFQNIDRKFNPFEQYNGGWFFNNGIVDVRIGTSAVISPNVASGNYKSVYRYKTNITLNAATEFDNTQSLGSIGQIYQYEAGQISAPSSQTINGKNYNFVWWTDNESSTNPRAITPTNNQTFTALYKYPNHSSSATAYVNNNQRKVVRTDNGYMHKVYESMGYVWYETSSDNGSTWQIANNGKPVTAGKNPSIDYLFNYVVIASQVDMGFGFDILISFF